ncbi:spore germination protein [Alkalihalobacterium elongatum]|uniref:spore germination protein n=1 Tax=Alkalihalobacterium elongatum TaxID=2675466 RepID=UPI001F47DF78|nr:spore germination protein [Alkalihalobacterium elongatum]
MLPMRLHKWLKKSKKITEIPHSHSTNQPPPRKVNYKTFQEMFAFCEDVRIEPLMFKNYRGDEERVLFVYSPGLCNTELIIERIIPSIEKLFETTEYLNAITVKQWKVSSLEPVEDTEQLCREVFHGKLVVFFETLKESYQIDISNFPDRSPEEANTEVSVLGPRDGFIENIGTNIALIRKRLPTNSLKYVKYVIGTRSKTKVGLLYVDDITNKETLSQVKERIENIDIDTLFSTNQMMELLSAKRFQLFPTFEYTGRTDFVVDSLMRGRFIIFVDGAPTALIGPANLFLLLKSAEDSEYSFVYTSFERILRLFGLSVAVFLPGFWIALVTFHQDQIPVMLLATLVTSRMGVPLPSPLEALVMLGLFELFREAGARLPLAIGQTLTVVGGLIIGDAAIRAGLTAPGMVVVLATSLVATFTLINQSLIGVLSILRIAVVIVSSFLGMFGFIVSAFLVLLYVANLRTFGVPYLAPLFPISSVKDLLDSVLRPSWKTLKQRPSLLDPIDRTRQTSEE